tara:strand:- start:80758 stop:80922 length:165 start_codon:yes stop_codon:yes gene_type:complete
MFLSYFSIEYFSLSSMDVPSDKMNDFVSHWQKFWLRIIQKTTEMSFNVEIKSAI